MSTETRTGIPHAVVDDARVPSERYYERDFFDLECQRLWPFVWQVACRLEDIPSPGDFVEYEIAGRSFLVVRQLDDSVRAFENACRHRGTALGEGGGSFVGGQIVCPFHAWRFDLDGRCSYVYGERGFRPDCVEADRLRLTACRVALRWGMVWINPSAAGPEFETVMERAMPVLDGLGLDVARVDWWRSIRIEANWKIALEAFLEAYHILQTHPELAPDLVGDEYDADAYAYVVDEEWGHGWLADTTEIPVAGMHPAEFMVLNNRVLFHGVDGWITPEQYDTMESLWARVPDEITPDEFLAEFFGAVYAAGDRAGAPLPERPSLGLGYVFPNLALISNLGNSLVYRFRPVPGEPEACTWEIWSVGPAPAATVDARPTLEPLAHQRELPPVYGQDASNMERQQKGLRSAGFVECLYSPVYETMIPNMHRRLDGYLAG